jgi:hypothetical protein
VKGAHLQLFRRPSTRKKCAETGNCQKQSLWCGNGYKLARQRQDVKSTERHQWTRLGGECEENLGPKEDFDELTCALLHSFSVFYHLPRLLPRVVCVC